MAKSKRKRFMFFLFVAVGGAIVALSSRTAQQSFDIMHDQYRTNKNWLDFKIGRPLAGTPDLTQRDKRLTEKELKLGAPIFIRIFKLEGELELWMRGQTGFTLFAVYPICRWSGGLGPKLTEGDGQSPEGFYTVTKSQLNPNSRWYRSFNLGYPNLFDKSHNRTGSFLMVHGGCSSIGCYAMTNPVMKELWEIINAAFSAGQKRFAVHAFPFRMTNRNMNTYSDQKWHRFWQNLQTGYEHFETTRIPPKISVCKNQYQFKPAKQATIKNAPRLTQSCNPLTVGNI